MVTSLPAVERLGDGPIAGFLDTREVVVLAMVGADGGPRATPMWFLRDGDTLVMISADTLSKVYNLRRDGRVAVVAESGRRGGEIRNVLVQGRAEMIEVPAERARLAERFLTRYEPDLERIWRGRRMPEKVAMFRITPRRVRSRGVA